MLAGHNALHSPSNRRIGARAIWFPIDICQPYSIAKSGSLITAQSGNVLGVRAILTRIRGPIVIERCEFHTDTQSRLNHISEAC